MNKLFSCLLTQVGPRVEAWALIRLALGRAVQLLDLKLLRGDRFPILPSVARTMFLAQQQNVV